MASPLRDLTNFAVMLALRLGVPMPPYTRGSALILETRGRKSGKRRRTPVGYVADDGTLYVVAEQGPRASYVRNARADGGRLRVFHRGRWKDATLRVTDADAETYLGRMSSAHASIVRRLGKDLRVVEIVPDAVSVTQA